MHHKYQALYALTWHYIWVKPSPRLLKYQALNPHGHAATVEDQPKGDWSWCNLVPQSIDQPLQGRAYVVVKRDDAADTLNPPTNRSMVTKDVSHIGKARLRCTGVHPAAREEEIGHRLRHSRDA